MNEKSLSTSGRDVLLVDDENRLRDMLTSTINGMDFVTTAVGSAESALRLLAERAFDIVIVDLNLPGMTGMQLFEKLRQQWPDVAVIVLTGHGDLESAKAAIRLDVVDFLTKPCAMRDLELALGRARQRRLERTAPPVAEKAFEEPPGKAPPPQIPAPAPPPVPAPAESPKSMDEIERESILAALSHHDGNRAAAAAELGISVRKLYYRLGQYQKTGLAPAQTAVNRSDSPK
jgi:DNA-binding NtrC family response regulator